MNPNAEAILQAAQRAIAERGSGKLTLSAVAAAAGVSRPTLYRWFPTKDALLTAMTNYEIARFSIGVQAEVERYQTRPARLDAIVRFLVTYLDRSLDSDPIGADPVFTLQSLRRIIGEQGRSLAELFDDEFGEVPAVRSGAMTKAEAAEMCLRLAYSHYLVPHDDSEQLLANIRAFAGLPWQAARTADERRRAVIWQ